MLFCLWAVCELYSWVSVDCNTLIQTLSRFWMNSASPSHIILFFQTSMPLLRWTNNKYISKLTEFIIAFSYYIFSQTTHIKYIYIYMATIYKIFWCKKRHLHIRRRLWHFSSRPAFLRITWATCKMHPRSRNTYLAVGPRNPHFNTFSWWFTYTLHCENLSSGQSIYFMDERIQAQSREVIGPRS